MTNVSNNILLLSNDQTKTYTDLNQLTKISDDDKMLVFQKYILKYKKRLIDYIKVNKSMKAGIKNKKDKYVNLELDNTDNWKCIYMAQIRGHNYNGKLDNDFYTLEPRDRKVEIYDKQNSLIIFPFNNDFEANNFLSYLKTDYVRGIVFIYKSDSQIIPSLEYIPWFNFSEPIFSKSPAEIDDYLFEKYIPEVDEETGITREQIREHIEEILPDYYGIRH